MHNPTRRMKRFDGPPYSTRRSLETTNTRLNVPNEDTIASTTLLHPHVRHQAAQHDALRGAMLVALVVVTIILYIILWELERSSFVSVSKVNTNHNLGTATSPSRGSPEVAWVQYPHMVVHDEAFPSSGHAESDSRVALSSGKPSRNTWPPPIARIPEEHNIDESNLAEKVEVDDRIQNENIHVSSVDSAYCNGACRLLLPIRIGEQESKARVHFTQLLMLARQLNRTMVLPNVGKSRMSACSKWPFDAYYDTTEFVRRNDTPDSWPTMDLEEFSKWVNERPVLPSGFIVSMNSQPRGRHGVDVFASGTDLEDISLIVEKAEVVDPKFLSCLDPKLARLRSSLSEMALSISLYSGSLKTDPDTSTRFAQLLASNLNVDTNMDSDLDLKVSDYERMPQYVNSSYLSLSDIDVLVLDYDLRHPLFAASVQPHFSLHYAPVLYDLADRLADNLGPFLGVHWRMENVPIQSLAWCAASLVSTIHTLLQDEVTGKDVRHVWLATDHPGPLPSNIDRTSNSGGNDKNRSLLQTYGPTRKSNTFKALTSEHDNALGILTEAFQSGGDLDTWMLTDLAEQLRRYPYAEGRFNVNETLLSDSGVFGILDKLVVVQAKVFISGSTDCSKTSSFSKQVIEARQESVEMGVIHNIVDYFGMW